MLTHDARFEGFTTEDWVRFIRLWQPRAAPELEATRPRGGVVLVHEDGIPLKILHTRTGRIDPSAALPALAGAPADALSLRPGQPTALERLARDHHASWAIGMSLGALDDLMERFGAGVRRGDDLTVQALLLVSIVRDLVAEGAIASWPQRLRGLPLPTPQVVHRTLDALCGDGRAIALGLFDAGGLWTAFVARRRGPAFDVIAGPDGLRPALGLLSGDWRRDYRHLEQAVVEKYAPLGFGCFAELGTFRALQTDGRPGAWSRAIAVRDVVIAPMPAAVGVAVGFDSARYALQGLRTLTGRIPPFAAIGSMLDAARTRVGGLTGKDIRVLLGFDPMAALRTLLRR